MLFYVQVVWRVGSPSKLGTDTSDAVYPYIRRTMPVRPRNRASARCVECMPGNAQVALESRLTGRRANPAGGTLLPGHIGSHIPILKDARRICRCRRRRERSLALA